MNSKQTPAKLTLVLFGEKHGLMKKIEDVLFQDHCTFLKPSDYWELRENDSFRVISGTKFFDDECMNPDQMIIDLMALSDPGPYWFLLAIESENAYENRVIPQISKVFEIFEINFTNKHLIIMLENQRSYNSIKCIKDIQIKIVQNSLADELKDLSLEQEQFKFDYTKYSQDTVKRRKTQLKRHLPVGKADGTVLNIVLLGKSGTGKSASGNTILAAGNSQHGSREEFKSYPSSTPVTTKCEVKMMKLGTQVRVVDTPDFFYEDECDYKAELNECKKYCKEEQCVVLLVIQLGRFTEGESKILEQLEESLGWRIRKKTIVLFTHGEDLNVKVEKFIGDRSRLKHIVEACGQRYHVFKNTTKDSKQVKALIENFPQMFPNFTAKQSPTQCCVC